MNSVIKRIANEAKNRLKNGYWEEIYKNREEDLQAAKENGVADGFVVEAYKQKINSALSTKRVTEIDESEAYPKVYDIILREKAGETVYNPIGLLCEKNYFDSLDAYGKQKYVFALSAVYIRLRGEIERELKLKSLKRFQSLD